MMAGDRCNFAGVGACSYVEATLMFVYLKEHCTGGRGLCESGRSDAQLESRRLRARRAGSRGKIICRSAGSTYLLTDVSTVAFITRVHHRTRLSPALPSTHLDFENMVVV